MTTILDQWREAMNKYLDNPNQFTQGYFLGVTAVLSEELKDPRTSEQKEQDQHARADR